MCERYATACRKIGIFGWSIYNSNHHTHICCMCVCLWIKVSAFRNSETANRKKYAFYLSHATNAICTMHISCCGQPEHPLIQCLTRYKIDHPRNDMNIRYGTLIRSLFLNIYFQQTVADFFSYLLCFLLLIVFILFPSLCCIFLAFSSYFPQTFFFSSFSPDLPISFSGHVLLLFCFSFALNFVFCLYWFYFSFMMRAATQLTTIII